MRYILMILVLCSVSKTYSHSNGDIKDVNLRFTQPLLDSVASLEFQLAGIEEKFWRFDSLIYFGSADSVKSFVQRNNANGPINAGNINFNDSALILVEYQGTDCHAGL